MPLRSLAMVLLTLFSAGLYAAENKGELRLHQVQKQTVPREEVVDALIEAVNQTTVSAQTSGRIVAINVDVDDYVGKGDVLVRFRDRGQRAALDGAEAKHAEAEANFKRMQELLEKKLVSQSDYDRAEAALKGAKAGLEQAQEEMEHTVVRAPYSGIVVARHVEPGETANVGTPLVTGLSLESLRAVANLSQRYIGAVRTIGKARVIFPGGEPSGVEGAKLTISPFADANSHTFKVRVDLPQKDFGVYPGMFAKVAFTTGEYERLVVPASAVVHRSEVTAVYVVKEDQSIQFRQIRVGRTLAGDMIEVLAGLDEGEQVAIEPVRAGVKLMKSRVAKP